MRLREKTNLPAPLFVTSVKRFVPKFAITKSTRPSPFKSSGATEKGLSTALGADDKTNANPLVMRVSDPPELIPDTEIFVRPAPLPVNAPVNRSAGLLKLTDPEYVPPSPPLGNTPRRLLAPPAKIAYGDGVRPCRGVSAVNAPPPAGRASICSHRSPPLKTPLPKSIVTVNKPLLTAVAEFVTGPATTVPAAGSSYAVKRKS